MRDAEQQYSITSSTGWTFKKENRPLVVFWMSIVAYWRIATTFVYNSTVGFIAGFIADVLSHPKLHEIVVGVVVAAINAFMNQEDIGTKIDDTARRVIYDTEKATKASAALGKEVIPIVTGFIGGVASSLKPKEIRRRKRSTNLRKKLEKEERDTGIDRNTEHFVSDLTGFSAGALTEGEEDFDDAEEDDDHRHGGWFRHSKKSK